MFKTIKRGEEFVDNMNWARVNITIVDTTFSHDAVVSRIYFWRDTGREVYRIYQERGYAVAFNFSRFCAHYIRNNGLILGFKVSWLLPPSLYTDCVNRMIAKEFGVSDV